MELLELPKTRKEARVLGLRHYFTGKPCKYGHFSKRLTSHKSCCECATIYLRHWKAKNPEKNKERADRYENREKSKLVRKMWKGKNRDVVNRHRRDCVARDPEKEANRHRAWRLKNMEVCRAHRRNRDAKVKGATGKHTKLDILVMYEDQCGKCQNCRICLKSGYHVDHKNPISKGGSNDPSNLQLLCPRCNLRKSNKDYLEWCAENEIKKQS